ncbi:MAG: hypothetical protein ACXQT5_06735 [Candidatus Syntropharchaeia archaeon]
MGIEGGIRSQWHLLFMILWSIPYSELEKLVSVFNGEKIDIDPSVWFNKL